MNASSEQNENPPRYSIVVPVFNSAKTLPELVSRLERTFYGIGESYEIILVEDCSTDNSWDVLSNIAESYEYVRAIELMRNVGQGLATICGFHQARGEIIITLDDDLQNPPEEIPKLLDRLSADSRIDVVIGVPQERKHGIIRNFGSGCINWMNSVFLEKPGDLRFSAFRAMRRKVVDGILTRSIPYPAIGPMIFSVTRRIVNIEVQHEPRKIGKSNYNFARLLRQTLSNIIGYTVVPLHILAVIGAIGILCSFIIGGIYLLRYFLIGSSVSGWMSLMLVVIAVGGFNFFAFALLGEYVKRIFYLQSTAQQFHIRNSK